MITKYLLLFICFGCLIGCSKETKCDCIYESDQLILNGNKVYEYITLQDNKNVRCIYDNDKIYVLEKITNISKSRTYKLSYLEINSEKLINKYSYRVEFGDFMFNKKSNFEFDQNGLAIRLTTSEDITVSYKIPLKNLNKESYENYFNRAYQASIILFAQDEKQFRKDLFEKHLADK